MVAVLVLRDNTASFPRRRESTGRYSELYRSFHFSFVGWAKRSVPNALEVSIPEVCQATCPNCQTAKSESPHPVFQVAGHVCVECFLGFACHDVEGGLSYDRCTVMDSRLRGNDGGGLHRRESIEYDTSFVGWAKRSVGGFHSRGLSGYLSELPSCQVRCSHIRFFRLLVTPV